jgi:hypothetical protein
MNKNCDECYRIFLTPIASTIIATGTFALTSMAAEKMCSNTWYSYINLNQRTKVQSVKYYTSMGVSIIAPTLVTMAALKLLWKTIPSKQCFC